MIARRYTRLTIAALSLSFVATGCGSSTKAAAPAATTATPAASTVAATTAKAPDSAAPITEATTTAASTSTSAAPASVVTDGSDITAEDRAFMEKSMGEAGNVPPEMQKCLLDELPGKITRAEYLMLAKAKPEDTLPDDLETRATDIARACAASVKAAGGTSDTTVAPDTTVASPTTTVVAQTVGKKDSPVAIGKKVSLPNGYDVVINSYQSNANANIKASDQYADPLPAGKQYVQFNISVTNTGGDKDKRTPGYDLTYKAVAQSGTSYESNSCIATVAQPVQMYSDLFKGKTTTGNACLVVDAADAKGLVLYFDVVDAEYNSYTYYFATN
jgi:hypothetical protein